MLVAAWLLRLWDSSWFRSLALLVVAVALFWAFYAWGMRVGAKGEREAGELRAQAAVAAVEADYREREKVHAKVIEQIRVGYAASAAVAAASDAVVSRDLADGTRRMRFKIAACRPSAPALGPTPGRADGAADAELAPEVAAALYAIAADGDQAIRQLTALQAWAKAAAVLCGVQ